MQCRVCPIPQLPELSPLAQNALHFSNLWDNPAHKHYRAALWDIVAPALSPSDVLSWLNLRSVVYGERRVIRAEMIKAEQDRQRREKP